ncbi:hypothetical protein ASF78_07885 [Cellulomonas sp. Leaf334]|nr:hypothetical protein ASF78_07885 [Cellulomonas sp. Leaf334]
MRGPGLTLRGENVGEDQEVSGVPGAQFRLQTLGKSPLQQNRSTQPLQCGKLRILTHRDLLCRALARLRLATVAAGEVA